MALLGKNKAFSAPRCVWCGKTEVANPIRKSAGREYVEIKVLFISKIKNFRLALAFGAAK